MIQPGDTVTIYLKIVNAEKYRTHVATALAVGADTVKVATPHGQKWHPKTLVFKHRPSSRAQVPPPR